MILGPLVEIELPDHSMRVPEGLKFAIANYLTAPTEKFREDIEGDNHEHYMVKIDISKGEFMQIDSTTRIDDRFSIETENLKNQHLCTLAIGYFNYCSHGIHKTFLVSRKEQICPHFNGAFDLKLYCKDNAKSLHKGQTIEGEVPEVVEKKYDDWALRDKQKDYKISVTFGNRKQEMSFSFYGLCESNGRIKFGDILSGLETINCKDPLPRMIEFIISQKDLDYQHPFIHHILPCQHSHACNGGSGGSVDSPSPDANTMSGDIQGNVAGNPIQGNGASYQENVVGNHNTPIQISGGQVTVTVNNTTPVPERK